MKSTIEKVMASSTSKASEETMVRSINSSNPDVSTLNENKMIDEKNKKFMSFDDKSVMELLASYHLTLTKTTHSGNLYSFKADDESGLFSSPDFPMSILVEASPSLCVTLTVINKKNNRVFIHKRGCNIYEGFEWSALDRLIWEMSRRSQDKIRNLKSI